MDLINNNYGYINGDTSGASGVFTDQIPSGAGTGTYNSFLRVQGDKQEQGANILPLNWEPNKTEWATKGGSFTHEITVTDFTRTRVTSGGTEFFALSLDVNENGGSESYLSLDSLRIFTRSQPINGAADVLGSFITNPRSSLPTSDSRLIWSMGGNTLMINANKSTGSGTDDIYLYLPVSLFGGVSGTDYVYLYSHFGGYGMFNNLYNSETGDGFEEWAVPPSAFLPPVTPVPEPYEYGLIGVAGLLVWAFFDRRQRKASAA
ncbi:MAG TPA: hypothetical protein P5055_08555 [Candidatus Paceibacterota bacterium]|nr:hypothetical protein [Candidatus Paceibacterota bacterium]